MDGFTSIADLRSTSSKLETDQRKLVKLFPRLRRTVSAQYDASIPVAIRRRFYDLRSEIGRTIAELIERELAEEKVQARKNKTARNSPLLARNCDARRLPRSTPNYPGRDSSGG